MNSIQDTYYLASRKLNRISLLEFAENMIADNSTSKWEKQIFQFILEWFDENDFIRVNTSGSTGKPKQIKLLKKYMVESAKATLNFLNLKEGDKALLCLPAEFIAGKMMIVRSLIGGLNLHFIKPSLKPILPTSEEFGLIALVPSMISDLINAEREKELENFENVLLGGSAIPYEHEKRLNQLNNKIWHTYGMTETITHIALRKINGKEKSQFFKPLQGVSLSLSEEQTLIINYPKIGVNKLITNDIAEIKKDGSFKFLGRKDNVIISGGLKIHPEEVEKRIEGVIKNDFFIYGIPDTRLGQKAILFIEGDTQKPDKEIIIEITQLLTKSQLPRKIIRVIKFDRTISKKTIRRDYSKNSIFAKK